MKVEEEEKPFEVESDECPELGQDDGAEMTERRVNGKSSTMVVSAKSIGMHAATDKKDGAVAINYKVDDSGVKEFGGAVGTFFAMFFFPFLMWYLWIGQIYYNAQLPWPEKGESLNNFWWKLVGYVMEVSRKLLIINCEGLSNGNIL